MFLSLNSSIVYIFRKEEESRKSWSTGNNLEFYRWLIGGWNFRWLIGRSGDRENTIRSLSGIEKS